MMAQDMMILLIRPRPGCTRRQRPPAHPSVFPRSRPPVRARSSPAGPPAGDRRCGRCAGGADKGPARAGRPVRSAGQGRARPGAGAVSCRAWRPIRKPAAGRPAQIADEGKAGHQARKLCLQERAVGGRVRHQVAPCDFPDHGKARGTGRRLSRMAEAVQEAPRQDRISDMPLRHRGTGGRIARAEAFRDGFGTARIPGAAGQRCPPENLRVRPPPDITAP